MQAWDHSPRTKKGKKVTEIILTADPFLQPIDRLTETDYEREGFAYLAEQGLTIWGKDPRTAFEEWKTEMMDGSPKEYWVIDFQLAEALTTQPKKTEGAGTQ